MLIPVNSPAHNPGPDDMEQLNYRCIYCSEIFCLLLLAAASLTFFALRFDECLHARHGDISKCQMMFV